MTRANPDSRSISPRGERFADRPDDAAAANPDALERNLEGKTHVGLPRIAGVTRVTTLEQIAALPVVAMHPLRLYLVVRGVSVSRAAAIIGVRRRQLA